MSEFDYGQQFIDQTNATPIPRDLFLELIGVTVDVKSGTRREIPPDDERCLEDLPPGTMYLTDCSENQMGMAIIGECRRRFPQHRAEAIFQSFMFRWWAVAKAHDAGLLKDFIKRIGKGKKAREHAHSAIFEAAADTPLNAEGEFDERFYEKARAIKAAEAAQGDGS